MFQKVSISLKLSQWPFLTRILLGRPVDALDNKCKNYKDCQKCVRERHGEECIGEFVRYTWKYSTKKGTFVSKNAEGEFLNLKVKIDEFTSWDKKGKIRSMFFIKGGKSTFEKL